MVPCHCHYHYHYTVEPCRPLALYYKYSNIMLLTFIKLLDNYMTIYHKAEMSNTTNYG